MWSFDPEIGSPEQWKERMSEDGEWGDEVFLCLAANVLSLDIVIVAARVLHGVQTRDGGRKLD